VVCPNWGTFKIKQLAPLRGPPPSRTLRAVPQTDLETDRSKHGTHSDRQVAEFQKRYIPIAMGIANLSTKSKIATSYMNGESNEKSSTPWGFKMTRSKARFVLATCSIALLLGPAIVKSQSADVQERVAALKQTVAQNQQRLRQYQWIETTVITVAGDEKSREQKQCYYGADGALQKITISTSPPPEEKFGLRGLIAEHKKEEMADYMKRAAALVHSYVPPNPERLQAVKEAGMVSLDMPGAGGVARLNFGNYLKPGDRLSVEIDPNSIQLTALRVASYLDDANDAVDLDVRFASLDDGTRYPSNEVLFAKAKNLVVNVTNSGYRAGAP